MVGFTAISERLRPEALLGLLRDFHGRLARVAFAHDGTVDKYIGDAIMVHFGTPRVQKDDPARALACAAAMIGEIRRWNVERVQAGELPIRIGIGVHYGEVLVGNIGDAQRLEQSCGAVRDALRPGLERQALGRGPGAVERQLPHQAGERIGLIGGEVGGPSGLRDRDRQRVPPVAGRSPLT